MSDDLEFIVIDDIPEYIFCVGDDEENERVIALSGKDGAFKYEKVAELPTTGEDGVLYLVPKSHTTQTASGNPISVNIADGAGKIESLKLDGDTYQQTYEGKNLWGGFASDFSRTNRGVTFVNKADGTITANGTATGTTLSLLSTDAVSQNRLITLSAGGYIISGATDAVKLEVINTSGVTLADTNGSTSGVKAFSISEPTQVAVRAKMDNTDVANNVTIKPMLEAGSTASNYEPFVGGTPSPNPSYPQPVQTVTGEQTVTINSTNYPISLGSIELCKIDTYQDYIYKDGNDWKVHKATNKLILDGSEEWRYYNGVCQLYSITDYATSDNTPYCGAFSGNSNVAGLSSVPENCCCFTNVSGETTPRFYVRYESKFSSAVAISQYLTTNPTSLYYALATPTDTTITDTALIAQLEAVRTAALSTGSNTISNTATGTNLAGDLEIGYYGYDPLNKYDKYFWLDVDGAYESL